MLKLQAVHHIAIICSDYSRSKQFYTEILGFKIDREVFGKRGIRTSSIFR
jgi:glyoxylase I family protein